MTDNIIIVREAYRLAEQRLEWQFTAALAADQRAVSAASMLVAAAAILAALAESSPTPLILLFGATGLVGAASLAWYSARPVTLLCSRRLFRGSCRRYIEQSRGKRCPKRVGRIPRQTYSYQRQGYAGKRQTFKAFVCDGRVLRSVYSWWPHRGSIGFQKIWVIFSPLVAAYTDVQCIKWALKLSLVAISPRSSVGKPLKLCKVHYLSKADLQPTG